MNSKTRDLCIRNFQLLEVLSVIDSYGVDIIHVRKLSAPSLRNVLNR